MSAPPRTPSGNIVLIEEYEALAIAFGSALRSSAKGHKTQVVRSLKEAEASLEQLSPTLLVMDCDPPPQGALAFLNKLRSTLPETRVLIIAAENSEEFTRENGGPAALQFMKKPFELEKFGETVRALLRAPRRAGVGSARDMKLLDVILLHSMTGANGVLQVEGAGERRGEIHFVEGRIVHAAVLGTSGIEALGVMLRWRSPRFSEAERSPDGPRTINGDWTGVLRRALANKSTPQARIERQAPAAVSAPQVDGEAETAPDKKPEAPAAESPAPVEPTKKIVVIDDTDLLLTFVAEMLGAAHPEYKIVTAATGVDGRQAVITENPDLVVLDFSLPDINGGEVCRQLRTDPKTSQVPIVMMSGHVPEMLAVAEAYPNVLATIAKPFLSSALIEVVERTLANPTILERQPPPGQPDPPTAAVQSRILAPPPSEVKAPKTQSTDELITAEPQQSAPCPQAAPVVIPVEAVTPITRVFSSIVTANFGATQESTLIVSLSLLATAIHVSSELRPISIQASLMSPVVTLRMLPQALTPPTPIPGSPCRLVRVESNERGSIVLLCVSPIAGARSEPAPRYPGAVDGVAMHLTEAGNIQLTPTASAPMRFELLGLFQLSRVELNTSFALEHLVLTARDDKMRATFFPATAHLGATFTTQEVRLDASGQLDTVVLAAV